MSMNKKRNRGLPVKSEGLKLIETKMREQGYSSREKLAEAAELTTKTIDNIFHPEWGKSPQRKTIQDIANVLDLDPADIVEGWYPPTDTFQSKITNPEAVEKLLNNPRQVCQKIFFSTQKRLTTNPLTNKDDKTFDYKDVCISLGLMERKKQQKIHKNFPTDREYNEYEVTRKFEQSEFFTEVLDQGNSPKSQGRKIAIIGEPGAGKTTKLQTIADWIFEQTEDVAIWVSLADLQEKSIEEYLLKVWLKNALKEVRVTPDIEDALVELFNQGRVWLLLDGVDEMAMKNPLHFINSQISGWVASARIILTCRLNVWDVGKNYLESFDAYRNLDFDSEQVKEFIGKWFVKNLELGEDLQTELEKPGKERIRDLIKNPLRLTLLCWFWQRRQGSFPETKAGLYKKFVEVFYDWKEWEPDCFVTQSEAKKKMEVTLGELAVKVIDKNSSRFRLTHREVCEVLGNVDTPLFKLVMKLGWLNKVGVAEENPDEEVYAFFHATFQEYFAAINISDRYFFLNHIPENPDRGTYRIFESQWKEVFLLWLGRDDVEKDEKEELIKALVEFEDSCGNFYWYRAYFLGALGIAEFQNYSKVEEIVRQLIKWTYGCFDNKTHSWVDFRDIEPIFESARIALLNINFAKEGEFLMELATEYKHLYEKYQISNKLFRLEPFIVDLIISRLIQIDKYNHNYMKTVAMLIKLVSYDNPDGVCEMMNWFRSREKNLLIEVNSVDITNCLLELLSKDDDIILIEIMGYFSVGNQLAIKFLIELINNNSNVDIVINALEALAKIDKHNPIIIPKIISIFLVPDLNKDIEALLKVLLRMCKYNPLAITVLTNVLQTDPNVLLSMAQMLTEEHGWIFPDDQELSEFINYSIIIRELSNLIEKTHDSNLRFHAALELNKLDQDQTFSLPVIADFFQKVVENPNFHQNSSYIFEICEISEILIGTPQYYQLVVSGLIQIINSPKELFSPLIVLPFIENENKYTDKSKIAEVLCKIAKNDDIVFKAIEEFIQNPSNEKEFSNKSFADSLIELGKSHPRLIETLIQLTNTSNYEKTIIIIAQILSKIPEGQPIAIKILGKIDKKLTRIKILGLGKIDKGNSIQVDTLVKIFTLDFVHDYIEILTHSKMGEVVTYLQGSFLDNNLSDDEYNIESNFENFELLWYCAQNMTYPDFYHAWHSNNSTIQNLENQITDISKQLEPTTKTYPIFINASPLKDETDTEAIAQEIYNQIHQNIYPNDDNIPEVNNAPQLKRLIPKIKNHLHTKHLSLILHKSNPHLETVAFCQKLTNALHIAWLTDSPLEPPLRGFPPNQPNLKSALQTWLNEISD